MYGSHESFLFTSCFDIQQFIKLIFNDDDPTPFFNTSKMFGPSFSIIPECFLLLA